MEILKPDGPAELLERVAIFVHYDGAGEVRPHTLHYIRSLNEAGFSVVVVSNAGDLKPASRTALRALCVTVIIRRNAGYDFGAIKESLTLLKLPNSRTKMLLLANDSVYGPLHSLSALLDRINFEHADVWGATDSWQRRYHLQSYFVLFGQRALVDPAWKQFWRSVRMVQSKSYVVSRYEIGLTQSMLKAGLRCAALFPYEDIIETVRGQFLSESSGGRDPGVIDPISEAKVAAAKAVLELVSARTALNPTADLWRPLLQSGYPFIKRELLQKNPSNVDGLSDWRNIVRDHSDGDIRLIEQDLQRTMKHYAA